MFGNFWLSRSVYFDTNLIKHTKIGVMFFFLFQAFVEYANILTEVFHSSKPRNYVFLN